MSRSAIRRHFAVPLALGVALLCGGCESASNAQRAASAGDAPWTVRMMVESNPPNARLLLNDIFIGGTPREVHLEVDESGNLLGTIEVRIEYALVSRGAGVLPLSSPPATATLQSGRRPPARLSFDGTIRSESGGPAPPDSTRTAPSIRATN